MSAVRSNIHRLALFLALSGISLCVTDAVHAADIYDDAVGHSGRTDADIKRDALDHPAEVLRAAGIRRGMQVADLLGADGYYSELLSYLVGPSGHVLLVNNPSFEKWSENAWQPRVAHDRLPNVEHRIVDLNAMGLPDHSLDAVLLIKVYHDLYWVDTKGIWPVVNTSAVLDQITRALKPGGLVLVVDHSAKPGTGSSAASPLHRIDEAYARKDFASHGLTLVGHSEVLRKPDDARDLLSYQGPALGKTDRFVLVFRKSAG